MSARSWYTRLIVALGCAAMLAGATTLATGAAPAAAAGTPQAKPHDVPLAGTFAYRAFDLPDGELIHGGIHAVVRIPGGTAVFYSMGGPGADSGAAMPSIGLATQFRPMDAWAVGIVDAKNMTYYMPMVAKSGECLCSNVSEIAVTHAKPNVGWAVLPPLPKGLTHVTVTIGFRAQITHVPVTTELPEPIVDARAVTLDRGWPKLPSADTIASADAPLSTRELTSNVAEPEAAVSTSEKKVSVALNSDVLFAVDQSVLTPRARQTLTETAAKINKNATGVVSIVGYTDDTGTTAHNQTLSEARAQSVLSALQPLVKNPAVTLKASGLGEQNPVADNGTDAGRQLNRRVTVTMSTGGN